MLIPKPLKDFQKKSSNKSLFLWGGKVGVALFFGMGSCSSSNLLWVTRVVPWPSLGQEVGVSLNFLGATRVALKNWPGRHRGAPYILHRGDLGRKFHLRPDAPKKKNAGKHLGREGVIKFFARGTRLPSRWNLPFSCSPFYTGMCCL